MFNHRFPGATTFINNLESGKSPKVSSVLAITVQAIIFGSAKTEKIIVPGLQSV